MGCGIYSVKLKRRENTQRLKATVIYLLSKKTQHNVQINTKVLVSEFLLRRGSDEG